MIRFQLLQWKLKKKATVTSNSIWSFFGIKSDSRLINVVITHTKSFKIIGHTDFCKSEGDPLPGGEALLDCISKKFEFKERFQKYTLAEDMLI